MTISVTRQGDTARIDIGTQLGVANRHELKQLVLDELDHGARTFLLDFGQTGFIDSSGLGVLVSAAKRIRQHHGHLRLLNLSYNLRALFRLTLLDKMFEISSEAPPGGEGAAGTTAPLRPRSPGPLYGGAEAPFPKSDDASPP